MTALPYNRTDGGRQDAITDGEIDSRINKGDCVTRAIAIATNTPYAEVYEDIKYLCETEKPVFDRKMSDPNNGVYPELYMPYIEQYFNVTAKAYDEEHLDKPHRHVSSEDFGTGTFIVQIHRHLLAIIDGVIHDSWDSNNKGWRTKRNQHDGQNCVIRWWKIGE